MVGIQLVQVAVDCKMTMDIEDYATSFRPDIIDAVSAWCQGATFAKVLTLTDVFEVGCGCAGTPVTLAEAKSRHPDVCQTMHASLYVVHH